MGIQLIVGLQNPGQAYEQTRHNAGGWFVKALARFHQQSFKPEKKLQCEVATIKIHGQDLRLAIPTTYMNLSGQPVQALSHYYRISTSDILVAHDELDLHPGRIKLKTGGGHGGHNGLRDIINKLNSRDFHRLRIGIGHPGHKDLVHNYVLGKPSVHDKTLIFDAIERSFPHVANMAQGNLNDVMTNLNT